MNQRFENVWDAFIQSYVDASNEQNRGLITTYEPEWPSQCVNLSSIGGVKNEEGEDCEWCPVKYNDQPSLENLASALEITIPADFETLMGRYYSLDLNAEHERGPLTILQVWNEQDYERLQKNLIAHVLMKRRLKQADTLFFALTDEDDIVISIELDTQAVVLEPVGKPAQEVLSDNLHDFIAALRPLPQFVSL